jgi:hypothetical protein
LRGREGRGESERRGGGGVVVGDMAVAKLHESNTNNISCQLSLPSLLFLSFTSFPSPFPSPL